MYGLFSLVFFALSVSQGLMNIALVWDQREAMWSVCGSCSRSRLRGKETSGLVTSLKVSLKQFENATVSTPCPLERAGISQVAFSIK